MKIHIVRKPFMCWEGQFTPGKRDLCIGLAISALQNNKTFRCYLGDNRKVSYEIDCIEALTFHNEHSDKYIAKSGKDTAILPLRIFTKIESKWNAEEYEKKEEIRQAVNAQQLNFLS
ncbi:MAG: hypothetical protein KCHDKBKB_00624 [Elusimicrobia bacterium]|nr:hypothetical protein [Elusimicrobiota bacterium]